MGWYTEYFSTLLKGIRITALKERVEVRKLVNNLKKADYTLYKKLIKEVEGDHKVTQAIKDEEKLLEELRISSEKAYDLIFNLSTEEIILLKSVEDILKELETFSKSIGANAQLKKVERDIALAIAAALKKAQSEDREEYSQLMLVIDESEKKDAKKFMAAVRLAFQNETSQSILAKFAARKEIRTVKVDILELQKIPTIIQGMREELEKRVKEKEFDEQKFIGELYGTIQKIKKYCNDAFYELYLIRKRDMLWILKVLFDLHNQREFNIKWARQNFMPRSAVLEKNKKIVEVQTTISKHFHVTAQAFRILIARIQRLEKEAEVDASKM